MKNYNFQLEDTEIYGEDGQTIFDIETLENEEILKILEDKNNEHYQKTIN